MLNSIIEAGKKNSFEVKKTAVGVCNRRQGFQFFSIFFMAY